jgi:L-threonylcarbamoyladenylate synthase
VDKAISLWRSGELVAIPTETVYGLAADASNGEAVAKIYAMKARPQFNPLIIHVVDVATAKRYVEWNADAQLLANAFWPGPLTLVLRRRADSPISALASAGGGTLAIRIPAHPVARQLLAAFGGGIAAPSANRSGRVSPTTAAHVRAEFGDALPLIIDGGACDVGLESTVIDLSGDALAVLRLGAITREMLEKTLGRPLAVSSDSGAPKSPGMLLSHYAPSIPVRMGAKQVAADEALLAFGAAPLSGAGAMLNLSASGDVVEAAANLFAHLRALDDGRFRAIAVMPIPNTGVGEAINDRLTRASAGR